jgi:hypothetical protein
MYSTQKGSNDGKIDNGQYKVTIGGDQTKDTEAK